MSLYQGDGPFATVHRDLDYIFNHPDGKSIGLTVEKYTLCVKFGSSKDANNSFNMIADYIADKEPRYLGPNYATLREDSTLLYITMDNNPLHTLEDTFFIISIFMRKMHVVDISLWSAHLRAVVVMPLPQMSTMSTLEKLSLPCDLNDEIEMTLMEPWSEFGKVEKSLAGTADSFYFELTASGRYVIESVGGKKIDLSVLSDILRNANNVHSLNRKYINI